MGKVRGLPYTWNWDKYANHHRCSLPLDRTTSTVVIHAYAQTTKDKLERRFITLCWGKATRGEQGYKAQRLQADAQAIDVRLFRTVPAENLGSLSTSLPMGS